RAGGSALAQLHLERPAVAARGDRFVVRSYSPSRTVGGGTVIEPAAEKRKRRGGGLGSLAVHQSGSPEARALPRLAPGTRPVAVAALALALGESEADVESALERLAARGEVMAAGEGRWIAGTRWSAATEALTREIAGYAARYPARYGIPKGELKSGLKAS